MALTDIVYSEGEGQNLLVELPTGTANEPDDITTFSSNDLLLVELEQQVTIIQQRKLVR